MTENSPVPTDASIMLSNRAYDFLSVLVKIFLPGFGALYFALAGYWGFPKADEVVGTCACVAVFLGLFLAAAKRSYNNSDAKYDGVVEVNANDPSILHSLDLDRTDPKDMLKKDALLIKIEKNGSELPPPEID